MVSDLNESTQRNDASFAMAADWPPAEHHFWTDPNISTFQQNATPATQHDESLIPGGMMVIKRVFEGA
ncbi:hypothetical protein V1282_005505 [Nitrobacteraceae bacterium AZCC 2146]|jgi:hypothetical protein